MKIKWVREGTDLIGESKALRFFILDQFQRGYTATVTHLASGQQFKVPGTHQDLKSVKQACASYG